MKFLSYADVLACDRALVGEWERDEPIRHARMHDNGLWLDVEN